MNPGRFVKMTQPADPCALCGNAREYRQGVRYPIHLGKCIPRKDRGDIVECKSCKRSIACEGTDIAIIVERHDRTLAIYCTRCAPTLVGVSDAVMNGRQYREFIANKSLTRAKHRAIKDTH